ncbi:hypothetical protein [Nonomuraea roseola]|uniref:Secreted protein n=1 Tax=Nonomuraea roseola TaxID=46179 RepID=A0ABV5Q5G9_9ACTN
MRPTARLLTAATLTAGGLLLFTAQPAHAIIDPITTISCLTETAADVTALVDPAAVAAPAEAPAVHCLQP